MVQQEKEDMLTLLEKSLCCIKTGVFNQDLIQMANKHIEKEERMYKDIIYITQKINSFFSREECLFGNLTLDIDI